MLTYTWRRVVQIWNYCVNGLLTGLDFNKFLQHYFMLDDISKRYTQTKTFGNE